MGNSITARRMISGLVLKYLNGECFVIWRGYETTLLASTEFNLTVPLRLLCRLCCHWHAKGQRLFFEFGSYALP